MVESRWNPRSEEPLPVLVVGVGHLGKEHARIYQEIDSTRLVGVVDARLDRAREIGDRLGAPAYDDLTPELLDSVVAASVVTPTPYHFDVAVRLMKAGISVLVEKPMASTIQEARDMIEIAKSTGTRLQVGHIERFNPVVQAAAPHVDKPVFIECDRIHPFSFRSIDISVVMDLMIHDIDLVLNLVDAPVASLDAVGAQVLSGTEDLAIARISFENGCVAMVKASRVAIQKSRKMRIFCANSYISLDHIAKTGLRIKYRDGFDRKDIDFEQMAQLEEQQGTFPIFTRYFNIDQLSIPSKEPLKMELESFVSCVKEDTEPVVTGEHGLQAIEIAQQITTDIQRNLDTYEERRSRYSDRPEGRSGPAPEDAPERRSERPSETPSERYN